MSDTLYRLCDTCPDSQGWIEDIAYLDVCPKCEGAGLVEVPTAVVPWCAEHNAEYSERLGKCWVYRGSPTACRLEEPARHYVMRGAE